jgi:hypothetical protein
LKCWNWLWQFRSFDFSVEAVQELILEKLKVKLEELGHQILTDWQNY